MKVLILYNEPALAHDHPNVRSEAGVLESVEAVTTALAAHLYRWQSAGLPPAIGDALAVLSELDRCDVVLNLFEGFGGVGRGEPEIAGLVELLGLPLTGSPAACLALTRDKARTKWLLAGAGLPTADFALVEPRKAVDRERLRDLLGEAPLIVKPAYEDASLGITADNLVDDEHSLMERLAEIHERYGAALVERFIAGREFNVGVLALPEPRPLPLAEIEFADDAPSRHRIVTYSAKWDAQSDDFRATPVRCPAEVDSALADQLRSVAVRTFQTTGCRDYARVDLRVDAGGQAYVLEVNANPDIGPAAGFARALEAAGIEYDAFIHRLVKQAYARRCPTKP